MTMTTKQMIALLVEKYSLTEQEAGEVVTAATLKTDFEDEAYEVFFEYFCLMGEMPYGTATAKDGDPIQWVQNRVAEELGV